MAYVHGMAVCDHCYRITRSWCDTGTYRSQEPKLWMGTLAQYFAYDCCGRFLRIRQHLRRKAPTFGRKLLSSGSFRWSLHRDHSPLDIGTEEQRTRCLLPILE